MRILTRQRTALSIERVRRQLIRRLAEGYVSFAILAPEDQAELVRLATEAAAHHGNDDEHAWELFCSLVLALGIGFEHDPLLPWVPQLLASPAPGEDSPLARARVLHSRMLEHLDVVAGADGQRLHRVWERALAVPWLQLPEEALSGPALLELWEQIDAPRYQTCNEETIRALLAMAADEAERLALGPRGQAAIATSMFLLGCAFLRDPQYRWAAAAWASRGNEQQRLALFLQEARIAARNVATLTPTLGMRSPHG